MIQKAKEAGTAALNQLIAKNLYDSFKPIQNDPQGRINLIKISWENYYKNKFEKYERLFMSENVKEYLTEEGKRKYERKEIVSIEEARKSEDKKIERFLDLFLHFDNSKVKGVTENVKKLLEQGLYIENNNDNVYINENGELDSYSFTPTHNTVTSRATRDNEEKRVFGFKDHWSIAPGKLLQNEIPGWTKSGDLINSEFKELGISSNQGIKIYKQTKNADNKANSSGVLKGATEGYVLDIDASNSTGFAKTAEIIKKLNEGSKKITQYRITNAGQLNENQNFEEIMKALPSEFPQLTIFLEGPNTRFLRHLKDKKIDQLDLFTTKDIYTPNGKSWSINPWALKGVAWVNTNDYNSPMNYNRFAKIASRIVFNSLSFDQEDLGEKKDGGTYDLTNINKGLRMAYYVRNNEGIFQGAFGNGLNPDHNEGENSYPTELDLSNTDLKSLRGLEFHDKVKSNNKPRKLKKLTLKSNGATFDISAEELANANLDVLDTISPGSPATEIRFSGGNQTKNIKITGSSSLDSNAYKYLNMYIKYGHLSEDKVIHVEDDNSELAKSLKSHGFSVKKSDANSPKLN